MLSTMLGLCVGSRFSRRGTLGACVALALAWGGSNAEAAQIMIDNFARSSTGSASNTYVDSLTQQNPFAVSQSGATIGALGQQRDYNVNVMTGSTPQINAAAATVGSGSFSVGTGGPAASQVTLQWSGQHGTSGVIAPSASPITNAYALGGSTGTGVDLTGGNTNKEFMLSFLNALDSGSKTGGPMMAWIQVTSGIASSNLSSEAMFNIADGSMSWAVPFTSFFQTGSSGPVNWNNVTSVQLAFNVVTPNTNMAFALSSVSVAPVPEPSTMGLVAAAAVAFGGFSICKRRGRKAVVSNVQV